MIQPRTLKGFRDFLPQAMLPRERLIEIARRVFRSYGFSPIDTPALEYLEILAGKGGEESDKQLYQFTDHGGRQVGMRFDLTVPLARFVAQHINELGTPFKRYHMGAVWRGENTQRGRYREFMQCDFDTIGTTSIAADVETALVIHDLFRALGITAFTIHVNNRKVLTGLLEKLGLAAQSTGVLRALDKLAKIGCERVVVEMCSLPGVSESQAREVLKLASCAEGLDPDDEDFNTRVIEQLRSLVAGNEQGQQGVSRLAELARAVQAAGVSPKHLRIDASIARGLDYYTDTVYETLLNDLPGIGSVCSGGRYDNLAGLYTSRELPGVGASLGLDRLLAALQELGHIPATTTPAQVFIPYFAADRFGDYCALAAQLRGQTYQDPAAPSRADKHTPSATINVEVYPEPKKLGQQLKYADRRGFRVALVVGSDEWQARTCQVKDLKRGTQTTLSLDAPGELLAAVRGVLETPAEKS